MIEPIDKRRMDWDEFLDLVLSIKGNPQTPLQSVVWKNNEHISFEALEHFIVEQQTRLMVFYYDHRIWARFMNGKKIRIDIWL